MNNEEIVEQKFTGVFAKLIKCRKPLIIQEGGTSSSKTYSEIQKEIIIARQWADKGLSKVTSIVSESLPHLKRGAIRDFLGIMKEWKFFNGNNWNKSEYTYKFGDSVIEFFSADNEDKMRGGRRDRLFINEVNNITFESFQQLDVRTKEQTTVDYNPVAEFFIHTEVMPHLEHDFIHSTYKDNNYLEDKIVKSIEARKNQKNWWRVFGLGEIGSLEGLVIEDWDIIKEIPVEAKFIGYGLDFGFTNDPTAVVAVYKYDKAILVDELIYETHLVNTRNPKAPDKISIEQRFEENKIGKNDEVIAECAEPKSIEELCSVGYNLLPVVKGPDSIKFGIDILNQHKISVTERSLNLIKEFRNYRWATNKDGKAINKPEDTWNHGVDALRYLAMMRLSRQNETTPTVIKFM